MREVAVHINDTLESELKKDQYEVASGFRSQDVIPLCALEHRRTLTYHHGIR